MTAEESVKQAYVDGFLTDAEFDSLIGKVVRGENFAFVLGSRKADPVYGPDLFTDPDLDPKNPEDAEPDGNWETP